MRSTRLFSQFASDNRGQVAILFALTALPLFTVAGIATDYSRAVSVHTRLQAATDAAVLAATNQIVKASDRDAVARAIFDANVANKPNVEKATVSVNTSQSTLTVSASTSVPTYILKVISIESLQVQVASSTSIGTQTVDAKPFCILALNSSADGAFTASKATDFHAINCSVVSNSSAAESLKGPGGPNIEADSFCAVGGYDVAGNFNPTPATGCDSYPDPLINLVAPPSDACASGKKTTPLTIDNSKKGKEAVTLQPGTYCGGIVAKPNSKVTFEPGIYVIKNGPLDLRNNAELDGEGVFFYFTGTGAILDTQNHANLNFSAPTTGPYAGILFAQDRTSSVGETSQLNAQGDLTLSGLFYFPTQTLSIHGNGNFGLTSTAIGIIADQVHLTNKGTFRIEADFAGAGYPDSFFQPPQKPSSPPPRLIN